jgi:hypothetical protein
MDLETFWNAAAMSKLTAKFAVAKEMKALPRLSVEVLRAVTLEYRCFTQAFATDIAYLVARCPEGRLRSLLARLLHEELGEGDPARTHLRLYDRFLETLGCFVDVRAVNAHPKIRPLLDDLRDRTLTRSPYYAIGLRGMGGECVCGVYFGVMHGHLLEHPYVCANRTRIDWRFWDIHAGHADVEHNEQVRAAIAELLAGSPGEVAEVAAGFEHGTAVWDAFWRIVYAEHIVPARQAEPRA